MRLYSYWRSTTSYRVRIALHLKGIDHEVVPVNLARGEQHNSGFAALNPARGVPVLVLEDGTTLTQSLAIIDYLEGIRPKPALLPARQPERARVMAAAHVVALDIHPVNNLRVVRRLKAMGHGPEETAGWMRHWMNEGLSAFQAMIRTDTPFTFGDAPGLADICLVAQLYNAHRWGLDLTPFARLTEIEGNCLALEAFARARPEAQPDAE